jgi:hypothetical protein
MLPKIVLATRVLAATIAALVIFAAPAGGARALLLHRLALMGLAAFLLAAQYQHVRAVIEFLRAAPLARVARRYRRLWLLTEFTPAPIALLILGTGLRLVAETGRSPREGWLSILALALGALACDGMLAYGPATMDLRDAAHAAAKGQQPAVLRRAALSWRTNLTLLVHFSAFAPLALIGWLKPELPNPLAPLLATVEMRLAPIAGAAGGAQLATLLLVATGALAAGMGPAARHAAGRRKAARPLRSRPDPIHPPGSGAGSRPRVAKAR